MLWAVFVTVIVVVIVVVVLVVFARGKASSEAPPPAPPSPLVIDPPPARVGFDVPLPAPRPPMPPPPQQFFTQPSWVEVLPAPPPRPMAGVPMAQQPQWAPWAEPPQQQQSPQRQEQPAPAAAVARPPKTGFTVVSYNVRVPGHHTDLKPNDWASRGPTVVEAIKSWDPDIICLQESNPVSTATFRRDMPLGFVQLGTQRSAKSNEAVHIFVNQLTLNVISSTTHVLTQDGPKLCPTLACTDTTTFGGLADKHPRIFTHAVLRSWPDRILHVINLHLSLDFELQHRQLEQLTKYVEAKVPHDQSLLVTGDFNSHYDAQERGNPLLNFVLNSRLYDSLDMADIPTFGDWQRTDGSSHRLDYVLFRNLLCVASSVESPRTPFGNRASDHDPVVATFEFKPQS